MIKVHNYLPCTNAFHTFSFYLFTSQMKFVCSAVWRIECFGAGKKIVNEDLSVGPDSKRRDAFGWFLRGGGEIQIALLHRLISGRSVRRAQSSAFDIKRT